jgi:hypothetical protein
MERGTPAATVHKTPVPAQVMHSRILRRLKPLSLFEVMPISFEAMLPSTSRSEIGGIYSRTFRHARRIGAARNDFATEFAPDLLELVVQALASHCRDAQATSPQQRFESGRNEIPCLSLRIIRTHQICDGEKGLRRRKTVLLSLFA